MYGITQIKQLLEADGYLNIPEAKISSYLYDSRRLRGAEQTLFVAISGVRHNGHDYIRELYKKGIRNFLVEEIPENLKDKANFLKVENTLNAFQKLAQLTREKSPAKVIAVTGSNGKTIVKEWLYQLLKADFRLIKNPKSYNSQLGVPLSVLQLKGEEELAVFEAGISLPGEMERLEKILQPEWGLFTNIGSAHQENFESIEQKLREKVKLFESVTHLVFCADQKFVADEIGKTEFRNRPEFHTWSLKNNKASVNYALRDQKLAFSWQGMSHEFLFPFSDEASVENALHALTLALFIGVSINKLQHLLPQLEPVSMRLEMKNGRWNTVLLNDAYNADLESLKIALEYFAQQLKSRERILVLSDIEQSGLKPEALYKEVARALEQFRLGHVFTIGKDSGILSTFYSGAHTHFSTTNDFLKHLNINKFSNKALLLKGARSFHFEDIDRFLTEKSHETVLEVHLNRLVDNLNYYRSRLKDGVKTMVMVKAFGYGAGAYEISSLLQFHKVDYLAVAYADEGVALRKAGIELPVMVLNTEISALDDMLDFSLEPEIFSFRILTALKDRIATRGENSPVKIHIKLETGMHRLGFEKGDLPELIEKLKTLPLIKVQSVFSHLAASDDPLEKHFTQGQISTFEKACQELSEGLGYSFDRHILNSSGISHYEEGQFEMVRLGIGLYGISSDKEEVKFLKPVSSLKATVSQVKHIKAGESVGYGRSYRASKDETIAVISLGYADGFRRSLSNGIGEVYIKGNFYPVAGRVCMDMTMINVSESDVKEGDEVEIFGPHISLYTLADKMETIPYEVLTSISERVKRIYLME